MRRRDSFLHLLVRLGIHESHPELAERLATEDIIIPDMRHTVAFAELMHSEKESSVKVSSASDAPASPEGPPRTRRAFKGPIQRLKERYRAEILQALDEPPDAIRRRFDGLTDIERRYAFSDGGTGAVLAGRDHYQELASWLSDTARQHGITAPRLVIVDSDLPLAAAIRLPGEEPTVFVGTNLLDILSDRQLKAVIGHELGHLKENQARGVLKTIVHDWLDHLSGHQLSYRTELRADALGARIAGGPEDMVDALRIMEERMWELKHFAKQVVAVFDELNLKVEDVLPRGLRGLPDLAAINRRIFPEPTLAEQRRATASDPHPPTVSRFDALFEPEQSPSSKSPAR